MMPPCGTFTYEAVVPERSDPTSFECRARSTERVPSVGGELSTSRLVGLEPRLTVVESGVTPNAGPTRPFVMRASITLTADTRSRAKVRVAWFHVDRVLIRRLQPGDVISLRRGANGGLGLSVLRRGELMVAVGAVTMPDLGGRLRARVASDVAVDAEQVYRRLDRSFALPEIPVAFTLDDQISILPGGTPNLPPYLLFLSHGFLRGVPGTSECGAIWLPDACPREVAIASAMLMSGEDSFGMTQW